MRLHYDLISPSLESELARSGFDVTAQDIIRRAQQQRAMVMGTMLADGIVWLVRLPGRIANWLRPSGTPGQPSPRGS